MIRKQNEDTAAEVAEDQAAEAGTAPDHLLVAAEEGRQRLATARAEAEQARTQADELEATAEAEAVRIRQEAKTEAQRLRWTVAPAADRKAQAEQQFVGYVTGSRNRSQQAQQAAGLELALTAEHDGLIEQIAGKDEKRAELEQKRQLASGALSAAEEQADVTAIQKSMIDIAALDKALAAVARQREDPQARLTAIGDQDGPGELYDAIRAFRAHSAEARKLINLADPDTEQARADRAAEERQVPGIAGGSHVAVHDRRLGDRRKC